MDKEYCEECGDELDDGENFICDDCESDLENETDYNNSKDMI